jgi:N-sulfoglucosamine sulfohydrolase
MPRIQLLLVVLLCCFAWQSTSAKERPNIILFISDDVSWNDHGCYGNAAARTPVIDQLAADGLRFDQAFLTASSCSPSRSSIVTGRYPHNNGKAAELHQPISANLAWFPAMLKDAGYYTVLSGKNHMGVGKVPKGATASKYNRAWHHTSGGSGKGNTGGHANWVKEVQDRPRDKPFFFWFASTDAHRGWNGDREWDGQRYGPKHQPNDVIVPPFLVDSPQTRQDLASYHNEVTRFDFFIGEVVKELKNQKVLDNTLLLVMADNGRPFPRAKTRLHDSGMKTPLVAHWPSVIKPRGISASIVSVIDIAPTILDAAGLKPAESMQGISFRPILENPQATTRKFAFSEHNWHDYEAHGRSVRSDGYLLIRNFRPQFAWQGPADSVRSPSHKDLLARQEQGKLTPAQVETLLVPRPEIELYHTPSDPNQLNNLAGSPKYAAVQERLAKTLDQWMDETHDSVPDDISRDSFHRRTGRRLKDVKNYRGTTPGEDRQADQTNAPGPR